MMRKRNWAVPDSLSGGLLFWKESSHRFATGFGLSGAMRWTFPGIVMVCALAGSARAQVVAPPPIPQDVTVTAPKDARVVATYPADGSVVPGGSTIVKIVFDQPMTAEAWSYTTSAKGSFPACLAQPRLLGDRRTFVLLCSLAVDTTYALSINAMPTFETAGGRKPPPYELGFKTASSTAEAGLHNALIAAGLTDADNPIQGTIAATGSVQSAPAKRELSSP